MANNTSRVCAAPTQPIPPDYYPFSGDPFIINYLYGEGNLSCSALADPDQAGLGVVFSCVIVAVGTTILSWTAHGLRRKLSNRPSRCARIWERVVERAILSLADQQLITGLALLISAHINRHRNELYMEDVDDYQDAHFVLVIYLSCLSVSSFFAGVNTLRRVSKHPAMTLIRGILAAAFVILLLYTVGRSYHAFEPAMYLLLNRPKADDNYILSWPMIALRQGLSAAAIGFLFLVSSLHAVDDEFKARVEEFPLTKAALKWLPDSRRAWLRKIVGWIIGAPSVAILQGIYTLALMVLVLAQRFRPPPPVSDTAAEAGIREWCGLDNDGENEWVFGQTVAVVMLLLPLLSIAETLLDELKAVVPHGSPAMVLRPSGRLDILVRGSNHTCLHRFRDSKDQAWSEWNSLPGRVMGDICAIRSECESNVIDMFARGPDGKCWHRHSGNVVWSRWESLGGPLIEPERHKICALRSKDRVDLFVCSTTQACWHTWHDNTSWVEWKCLGPRREGVSYVDAVFSDTGRLHLFGCGTSGKIYHKALDWGSNLPHRRAWSCLGGECLGKPMVVSLGAGRVDVFARLRSNRAAVHRATLVEDDKPQRQASWESLGELPAGDITLVRSQVGVELFLQGAHNSVYQKTWKIGESSPSGWHSLGGVASSQPSAVACDTELALAVRGTDNAIWIKKWNGSKSEWLSWESLGTNTA
ncbi:hypothetical protein B0I35DRAFT_446964 [Stachybotrys elegans]|uniref:PLL-like beta propeller domain-containing protein n=1 Tax=Stachybotrys elegans TaxID=80388 RepID=A0A8K0SAQ9_9HYPO|nr:hypothetical protein B0I35DRAFT_446964 [Stachybotrys elegans]